MHRGMEVNVSMWCLRHSEHLWQDAETVKPNQWLEDQTGGDRSGSLAYIPVGVEPCTCVQAGYVSVQSSLQILM